MSSEPYAIAYGVLPLQISVSELRRVLASCGLTPSTGDTHHVHVLDCDHFVFREDGKGSYLLSADAPTVEALLADATRVSEALIKCRVRHSFEVYDHDDRLVRVFSFPGQGSLA
jgi:hypothetical protein